MLAQLAARAQHEADLDTLSAGLLATVDEALKPDEVRLRKAAEPAQARRASGIRPLAWSWGPSKVQ